MEKYREGKCIGRGAYGKAYVVTRRDTKEQFVAKKVELDGLPDDEREATEQEVKLLQELGDHPNIVQYYESFVTGQGDDSVLCIVMMYCEGGDLEGQFKRKQQEHGHFDEKTILDWIIQIAFALLYIHERHPPILHRYALAVKNLFSLSH